MSLEHILEKIRREAQEERDNILRESRERAARLKAEAEQEVRSQRERILREAEQESELEAHRLITQARLQKKLRLLEIKKSLVEEVLEKAFGERSIEVGSLKRTIVRKDGVTEEALDPDTLREELRPQLESYIAGLLKL